MEKENLANIGIKVQTSIEDLSIIKICLAFVVVTFVTRSFLK